MSSYKPLSSRVLSRVSHSMIDKKGILQGIDHDTPMILSKKFAEQHHAIAMFVDMERYLHVAMANPWDLSIINDIEYLTRHRVLPSEAPEDIIHELIEEIYQEQFSDEVVLDLMDLDTEGRRTTGEKNTLEDVPIIHAVSNLIRAAYESSASDIHVEPAEENVNIRFRIDGILYEKAEFSKAKQSELISRIKILGRMNIAEKREPQDGRFTVSIGHIKLDVRVSSLPTYFGEKLVLRLLRKSDINLKLGDVGMSHEVLENYQRQSLEPRGLILISGPTGSGKTTTLYSTLSFVNDTNRRRKTQTLPA